MSERLFDADWYARTNDLRPFPSARAHYVAKGAWLGLSPHPLVDPRWLTTRRSGSGRRPPSPLRRARAVLRFAAGEASSFRNPHPLFDVDWYLEQTGPMGDLDPLTHFLLTGEREGRSPHPLIDPAVFRAAFVRRSEDGAAENGSDRAPEHRSPLTDYALGHHLDARTHELFDGSAYREFNADVASAGVPPLEHYVRSGHSEDRHTLSPFEESWARVRWGVGEAQVFDAFSLATARTRRALEASRARLENELAAEFEGFLAGDEHPTLGMQDDGEHPDVTVIIPVWNKAHLTLRCFRALAQAADLSRFAVHVVNNGSMDSTDALLERFPGVVVTRWEENRGYGAAINHAAAASDTEYLLLLNNDAFVDREALHHARQILHAEPDVGAVSGRIVLPNGMLQEAGSYVLPDGSSRGYLRGLPATHPSALNRRDVDFGSAAFLLIRRQVFLTLGGFDPVFGPAYGEDADLMLRMWNAGWRTTYEPRCVITHLEGASSSNGEAAERMREAARLIRTRHADVLSLREDSSPAIPSFHAAARVAGPHIIVIDDEVPDERAGAGQPRAKDVIKELLGTGARVTLLTRGEATDEEERLEWRDAADAISRALEVVPGLRPAQWLEVLEGRAGAIDLLWVSRTRNMTDLRHELTSRRPGGLPFPVVFDCEALDVERDAARAAQLGTPWSQQELDRRREEQFEAARFADVVTSVSEHEARIIGAAADRPTIVVGHRIERGGERRDPPAGSTVLFVGRLVESDSPNALELRWFIDHVWPAIERGTPATLSIVGKAGRWTDRLRSDRVHVVGEVDDLAPIYGDARVCIVPTFLAAGIPHKVHMAAAHGLPTVVTELIASQAGFAHECETLIADSEGDFVAAVARLLTDDDLWRRISSAAWERIGTDCSGETFSAGIAAALHEAAPLRFRPAPKPTATNLPVSPPPAFDPDWYRLLHADLVSLNKKDLEGHYLRFGRSEGRRANALESRTSFAQLAEGRRTLEIGPYWAPLLQGPGVEYADWLSTEDLRGRAKEEGAPSDAVPRIDHVLSEMQLGDIDGPFDAILSSHVIEHQPDVIKHLQDVESLLRPGGRYFVLVPDKRYCFDAWISESTIAEVLQAHIERRRRHSLRSVIEHRALTTHNDPTVHWQQTDSRPSIEASRVRAALDEFNTKPGEYIDVHAWYFVPESFAELVRLLGQLGIIRLELEQLYPTRRGANEFWAIMKLAQNPAAQGNPGGVGAGARSLSPTR